MNGLRRSIELLRAFRRSGSDPATFYGIVAAGTVADIAGYCDLSGSTVLDVGGASGYLAEALRDVGARTFTVEYDPGQMTEHGRNLADGILGDGRRLPVATGAVDVSYSSNVLEHVMSYELMLAEMVRVVPPGGLIYISFTNWLSPYGGHETSPWHYLGGDWAARRYERATGRPPKNKYGTSLFKLAIAEVLNWCEACPEVDVVDAFPRYYPRWVKWIVRIPGVREFLTWNLVVVMRRRSTATLGG